MNDLCVEASSAKTTLSFDKKATYFDFKTTLLFDEAFNIKKSSFGIETQLTSKKSNIDYLKINSIEITAKINNVEQTIGRADINKYLWESEDKIIDKLNVDYQFDAKTKITSINVIISYEYLNKKSDGTQEKKTETYQKSLSTSIDFFNPSTDLTCNPSTDCDISNRCLISGCIKGTALCEYQRKPNCCGNFECDSNENKASCPKDCGNCEKDNDEYTYYAVSSGKCILEIKDNVQNPVVVTKTTNIADAKATIKNSYNNPFNTGSDTFTISITLDDATEQLFFPFKITKIQLIYKSIVLAEDTTSLKIVAVGRTVESILPVLVPPMNTYRDELEPTLRLFYEYDQQKSVGNIDVKRGTYDVTFGQQIIFINPE